MITGCVLVKNEADLLENCLKSLSNFVDEIIVVDNGSTDHSKSVAEKFGCRVINFHKGFQDHGRNEYLKVASHPWVLVLDADEEILSNDGTEIRKYLEDVPSDWMGIRVPRFDYIGEGKWAFVPYLRLFRNNSKIKYTDRSIHASPGKSIRSLGGEVGYTYNFFIHHYDILIKKRTSFKREKYLKQIIDEINSDRGTIDLFLFLGLEYTSINRLVEAEEAFNKIAYSDSRYSVFGKLLLAQFYILNGNLDKANELGNILLETLPLDKLFLFDYVYVVLAEVALRRGQHDMALSYCLESLKKSDKIPHVHINIASLIEKSNPEKAIGHLDKAVQLNPLLKNKIIYVPGEKPNVFDLQTSFLSSTRNIYSHYALCYKEIGNIEAANQWEQEYSLLWSR